MKRSQLATAIKLAMTGVLAGALVACGGGGSGSGGGSQGTTSSGTSIGPVSGFGSVYVNGVRFHTNGSVSSDDGIEREDQLEKGMILKVRGSWDDSGEGEAIEIEYDDTLRGPLQTASWDGSRGELTVVGLKVKLDGQTVFRGATPEELRDAAPGTYKVRISAWPLASGDFRASYVGAGHASTGLPSDDLFNEVEVKGVVTNHDADARTFTINGLQVNYTRAVADDDFALDRIANGIGVEVEGFLENGVLFAKEIDDEDDFFGLTGDIQIQGAIEGPYNTDNKQQFVLNGVTVQVSNGTEFKDGLLENELVAGLLVKVEGRFNSNNVLVAREIEPKEGDAEVEARVESLDPLMVGGVQVALTGSTLIEIETSNGDRNRNAEIGSLSVGDFVEVEGRFRNGVLEAVSIEREEDADPDEEFDLDGRVTENTGDSITVLGVNLLAQNCISGFSLETFPIGTAVEVDYFKDAGGSYLIRKLNEDRPDPEVDGPDVICSDGPDDSDSDDSPSN